MAFLCRARRARGVEERNMLELNENDFDRATARGTFVVDFSAEWCPPCRMLMPVLEKVAARMEGRATFAKVDAEANAGLSVRFGVSALPTLVVLRDGRAVRTLRGLRDERTLTAELGEVIGGGE